MYNVTFIAPYQQCFLLWLILPTDFFFFLFTVNVVELGRKMYNKEIADVAALLAKPNDSEEVKQVKKLITDMLAQDPSERPCIGVVVDRLSQLRISMGVQVLVAVDTVWKPSVYYSKYITFHILEVLFTNVSFFYFFACLEFARVIHCFHSSCRW